MIHFLKFTGASDRTAHRQLPKLVHYAAANNNVNRISKHNSEKWFSIEIRHIPTKN
jgi:hypothetical protein